MWRTIPRDKVRDTAFSVTRDKWTCGHNAMNLLGRGSVNECITETYPSNSIFSTNQALWLAAETLGRASP